MIESSRDRTHGGRPSDPPATPARRGYARRIDCAETAESRPAEETCARGRGTPDPEAWNRPPPVVH